MLPDSQNHPTCLAEELVIVTVALAVASKLRQPVIAVHGRYTTVDRAGVPETTIDKDGDLRAPEDDVGARRP